MGRRRSCRAPPSTGPTSAAPKGSWNVAFTAPDEVVLAAREVSRVMLQVLRELRDVAAHDVEAVPEQEILFQRGEVLVDGHAIPHYVRGALLGRRRWGGAGRSRRA